MANIIASFLTFLALSNNYLALKWKFNFVWKNMMRTVYLLIAGIAFAINEQFDKILLGRLLPANIAEAEVGYILPVINWVYGFV
jgi:hypothetical protein